MNYQVNPDNSSFNFDYQQRLTQDLTGNCAPGLKYPISTDNANTILDDLRSIFIQPKQEDSKESEQQSVKNNEIKKPDENIEAKKENTAATKTVKKDSIQKRIVDGTREKAIALARKYLGMPSRAVKGLLRNFQAAGGWSNNCADFVSSVLQNSGRINKHYVGVPELEQGLIKQGYKKIPVSAAKPGDVWISNARTHTELVSEVVKKPNGKVGFKTIGSNNVEYQYQEITERWKSLTSGIIIQKQPDKIK